MYENTAAFFPDRTERERRTGGVVVSSRRLLTTLVSGTRTRKHLRTNLFGGAASEWPKAERKQTAADEKKTLVGRQINTILNLGLKNCEAKEYSLTAPAKEKASEVAVLTTHEP